MSFTMQQRLDFAGRDTMMMPSAGSPRREAISRTGRYASHFEADPKQKRRENGAEGKNAPICAFKVTPFGDSFLDSRK